MKKILLFIFLLSQSVAEARWIDHGNAGDAMAAEFILTGRDLVQRMQATSDIIQDFFDIKKLSNVILTTQVRSEVDLKLRGQTVDAINLPEQSLIILNRDRWRDYRSPVETKARITLVLHEYLSIMGLDDAQFQISGSILGFLDVQNYSPGTWWNPLNPSNFLAVSTIQDVEGCSLQNISFDPRTANQEVAVETLGTCGESYRKVIVKKNSLIAPPSEQIHGTFHRYDIVVLDRTGASVGEFEYEPEWGKCLFPEEGSCRLSGSIKLGGLEFSFWYRRNEVGNIL